MTEALARILKVRKGEKSVALVLAGVGQDGRGGFRLDALCFGEGLIRLAQGLEAGAVVHVLGGLRRGKDGGVYLAVEHLTQLDAAQYSVDDRNRLVGGFARAVVAGVLASDPDLRYTPKGTAVCRLRVGVPHKGGWAHFPVEVWEADAERVAGLAKGTRVVVQGTPRTLSYTAEGETRRYGVIAATRVFPGVAKAEANAEERAAPEADVEELAEAFLC